MSAKLIKKEGYTVEFEMSVSPEVFENGMQKSYIKNVKSFNIPGFRKGKAPRKFIEKIYSEAIFYDDAVNTIFPEEYEAALADLKIEPVSRPDVDIKEIGSGKALVLTVKVDVQPDVELKKYKGLSIDEKKYDVTADDVKAELEQMRNRNSRMITVEDRAVKKGDIAVIDYEGFVDEVAFEGGKDTNHELEIGSGAFIPGFEDQIIGANTGDELDVNVTFPKEYHAEDLKGKKAVFKVKVNQIKVKELPELNDEFAKDASEFDTLKELKADIKAKFVERNEKRAKAEMENSAIEALVNEMVVDIPEAMIETRTESLIRDTEMRLYQQGLNVETYLRYVGMTMDDFKKQMRPQAETAVKSTLALEKVVELEKIEVSEEELNAKLEEMAKGYGMELDKIKETLREEDKKNIEKDCAIEKAINFILENAKVKKAAAKTTKKTDDESEEKAPAKKTAAKKTTTTKKTTTKTADAEVEEKTPAKKTAAKKATTTKKTTATKTTAKKTTKKDAE